MRVALVTGASRGIGAAIAAKLAEEGVEVALCARDAQRLAEVEASIVRGGGEARYFVCDVTDRTSVGTTLDLDIVEEELGQVSILVNNAGWGGPFHLTNEVSDEEWERIFATNIRSAFWFCRRLLPQMRNAGFGRVINISSVLGLAGAARSSTYTASKHALVGYTKALAVEWGGAGVTCNVVCPGYVATDMTAGRDAESKLDASMIPVGRYGQAREVAEVVAMLARLEAGYLNGSIVTIDGGLSSGLRG